jgi:hypothetical protein
MIAHVDDRTAAYIAQANPAFADLRQVAGQLSGWLVLNAVGAKEGVPEHPVLAVAKELLRCAHEDIESLRPTPLAHAHHAAMRDAALLLGRSFPASATIEPNVKTACRLLEISSRLLPGFEMVDFGHGCCAKPVGRVT